MDGFGFQGSQLPLGFRFHPADQELITHYLSKRVTSSLSPATSIIAEIDLYKFDPWELPKKAFFGDGEWFFFSPRDRKYPNGSRPNRAATSGYWKATGTDKPVIAAGGSQRLGVKKGLVFYKGRPLEGTKTDWIMHEYRLLDDDKSSSWLQKPKSSMRVRNRIIVCTFPRPFTFLLLLKSPIACVHLFLCRVRHKGSTPNETDEKQETSCSADPSACLKSEEHKILRQRRESIDEWSDNQLLDCLLSSLEEGGESTSEVLDSSESFSQDTG